MKNTQLTALKQARRELSGKLPVDLRSYLTGLGIGTKEGTTAGNAGELEVKLSEIPDAPKDFCIRVYLNRRPSENVRLPSTYRGIYLGYVVTGKISAL